MVYGGAYGVELSEEVLRDRCSGGGSWFRAEEGGGGREVVKRKDVGSNHGY